MTDGYFRVHVVVPVSTRRLLRVIEHIDDVVRELALIQTGRLSGMAQPTVPDALLSTMDNVRQLLFGPKERISGQLADAFEAGEETVELRVDLRPEAVEAIYSVLEAFEAVDAFSVGDGSMLIPAAAPEVADYRRWFFLRLAEELVAGAQRSGRSAGG